ncbi:MAG: AlwI family type II restriction endonuclease [Candidatus Gastranaerophilales bacterium]|nr:AlwI family type II restriction endonuclease [Candidatus Gastranaerophilales bacterium]
MDTLWSMTTTIREAERIPAFLKTAKEMENDVWDEAAQIKFQTLLIKNREYLNTDSTQTFNKLNAEQINLLKDKTINMTYAQAKEIFETKQYEDAPMRGRQSMSPLEKLGLVDRSTEKIIITDVGNKLLNEEITFDEFMFESLLKLQYPNQIESERRDWNSKPFINALRLIKKVNELCQQNNMKEKGLTKIEFGIFALSIKNYSDVDDIALKVIEFRKHYETLPSNAEKEIYRKSYIAQYLSTFNNPEKNTKEYTDNVIRYMRITKYIYIRGKYGNACVDLEPRRMVEINSIIENDNGAAKDFSKEDWIKYFTTYGTYNLPFDTVEKLQEIFNEVLSDINKLEEKLNFTKTVQSCPATKTEIKSTIADLRAKRVKLQNLEIKFDYSNDILKINETIDSLLNIRKLDLKPSIALEKWVNVALNIINDSLLIKPNSIVGDDNEPTFTAPAGVPDIECFYSDFNATCEVTMLASRDQWFNEGQPVMRHLREFENIHTDKDCYCLFVAPSLHTDTINTYYTSIKYEYAGAKQKIIPITIKQLIEILKTVAIFRQTNIEFKHAYIRTLYDKIIDIALENNSESWLEKIPEALNNWKIEMNNLLVA